MADSKTKRDYRDRARISMKEAYEVAYWKKKFGISSQQLAEAVHAAGPTVKKVIEYLRAKS